MKKKLILNLIIIAAFIPISGCFSVPSVHYLTSVDDEEKIEKLNLMMQLYNDEQYDLTIRNDQSEIFYQNKIINKSYRQKDIENSKVLEFTLKENTKYIIVNYNKKKYKINVNSKFKIIFLDIRLNRVDVGYTNRNPIF